MNYLDMMTDPFDATMAQIDFEKRMGVPVRYRTFPDFSLPFALEDMTYERDATKQECEAADEDARELRETLKDAIEWYENAGLKTSAPAWYKEAKKVV